MHCMYENVGNYFIIVIVPCLFKVELAEFFSMYSKMTNIFAKQFSNYKCSVHVGIHTKSCMNVICYIGVCG